MDAVEITDRESAARGDSGVAEAAKDVHDRELSVRDARRLRRPVVTNQKGALSGLRSCLKGWLRPTTGASFRSALEKICRLSARENAMGFAVLFGLLMIVSGWWLYSRWA
ncbi:MAG: hypothetical protein ABIZ18_07135, partial [Caldimonas sp.]